MRALGLVLLLILAGCAGPPAPEANSEDPRVADVPADSPSEGDRLANGTASGQADEGAVQNESTAATGNQSTGDDASGAEANETSEANGSQDGNGTDPDNQGDQDGNQSDPDGNQSSQTSDPDDRLLEVSVFDYTSSALARPHGTEIDVVGADTWKPDLSYGSAGPEPMGHHVVNELQEEGMGVFPDGRDGVRCAVDLRAIPEMEDESHESITQVEIYDAEVWIYGMAIPGHPDWESPFVCGR